MPLQLNDPLRQIKKGKDFPPGFGVSSSLGPWAVDIEWKPYPAARSNSFVCVHIDFFTSYNTEHHVTYNMLSLGRDKQVLTLFEQLTLYSKTCYFAIDTFDMFSYNRQ